MIRSALFVPADSERKLAKGLASEADALFIDLEDSVAHDGKADARAIAAEFLGSAPPKAPTLFVRVNAFDTGMTDDDLAAIMPGAPAGIVLPKSANGADVQRLDAMLRVHELENGIEDGATKTIAIVTETAAAVFGAGTYAGSSDRLTAMTWGAEDLAADVGTLRQRDDHGHYTDLFRFARTQCLLGATSAGVQAMDTVYPDFRDDTGFKSECAEAAADGFTGKMAIHPAQVPIINAAFTPSADAVQRARAIVEAFEAAGNPGVVSLDGSMLDRPHLRKAQALLTRVAHVADIKRKRPLATQQMASRMLSKGREPRPISGNFEFADGRFAGTGVDVGFVGNLLAFGQAGQAAAFQSGCMNENVLAAVLGLDEAVAFGFVIEFYGTGSHGIVLAFVSFAHGQNARSFDLGEHSGCIAVKTTEAAAGRPIRTYQLG